MDSGNRGREGTAEIPEVRVGEYRPSTPQTPIARFSSIGPKARDTCLPCAGIPHRPEIPRVRTSSALDVAYLATYKLTCNKWIDDVRVAMESQCQHHEDPQLLHRKPQTLSTTSTPRPIDPRKIPAYIDEEEAQSLPIIALGVILYFSKGRGNANSSTPLIM